MYGYDQDDAHDTLWILRQCAKKGWGLSTKAAMDALSITSKRDMKYAREQGLAYDYKTQSYPAKDILAFILQKKQAEVERTKIYLAQFSV